VLAEAVAIGTDTRLDLGGETIRLLCLTPGQLAASDILLIDG
jgi:hypothetical protein